MSVELEKEAMDVAVWWSEHRDKAMDVPTKIEFLIKVNDHLLWLLGRAIQDIKNLEHRDKTENNLRGFLVPRGIRLKDGLSVRA